MCTEAALQCIREKMDLFDIDDDKIDAQVLEQMSVCQEHFKFAMGQCNPASLRETVVEVPNVKWEDIGGNYHFMAQLMVRSRGNQEVLAGDDSVPDRAP